MASKDPSPEDITNLEKEQREAELQAEFDEFERQERARAIREREVEKAAARQEKEESASTLAEINRIQKENEARNRQTKESRRLQFRSDRDTAKSERLGKAKVGSMFSELQSDERKEEDRKLQMEFDLFERKEKERRSEEARYDAIRSRIETSAGKKSYTGFRVIDEYLDASDTKKSKAAAAKWEKEYKDIETREKAGKISPDYASFLKTQAAEKLQAGKKSKARYMIEEAQRTGSGLIKAGDSYLSNAPSRGGGGRKPSLKSGGRSRKAAPRQNGFSSGIGMGVAFPQMMVAPPQPRQGNGGQRKPQPSMGSIGFPPFTVSTPKPKGNGKPSGPKFPTMSFSTAPKFGKSLLTPRSPFGAKKTNPLKGKKKSLW